MLRSSPSHSISLPTHTQCCIIYQSFPTHHSAIHLTTQTKLNTTLLVHDYPTVFYSVLGPLASLPIQCQFCLIQPFRVTLGIVKTYFPSPCNVSKVLTLLPHSSSPTWFLSHLKTHTCISSDIFDSTVLPSQSHATRNMAKNLIHNSKRSICCINDAPPLPTFVCNAMCLFWLPMICLRFEITYCSYCSHVITPSSNDFIFPLSLTSPPKQPQQFKVTETSAVPCPAMMMQQCGS